MRRHSILVLPTLLVLAAAACSESPGTDPTVDGEATVVGRVDRTSQASAATPTANQTSGATGSAAETAAVVRIEADGSLTTLAEADVAADRTFRITGVPAGEADLAVVARTGGQNVGRVLLYERTRDGATHTTAPIDLETTVEGRTWARLHARGRADETSAAEVALLTRTDASVSSDILVADQVDAAAQGMAEAGAALTATFAGAGTALDARARAELLVEAAMAYASSRHAGADVEQADRAFVDASLNAFAGAGVAGATVVSATAAAGSVADARMRGAEEARGSVVTQAVRLNLEARERLAARVTGGEEGSLSLEIREILADARADLHGGMSAASVRARMDVAAAALASATVDELVDVLVPGLGLVVQNEVRTRAQAAVNAARLSTRFGAAGDGRAAAQAVAGYRAEVRAAVEAMLEAAGRTDLDVDAMTSLYIAAHGGVRIG